MDCVFSQAADKELGSHDRDSGKFLGLAVDRPAEISDVIAPKQIAQRTAASAPLCGNVVQVVA